MDYMVMEAVCIRVGKQEEKERKDAEERQRREEFKKDKSSLEMYR